MSDRIPSYRRHKASGQAVVTLPDGQGNRKDILLGKYGSKESRAEYLRVIAEWETSGRRLNGAEGSALSINELILRYWEWAQQHYRHPDGRPTSEQNDIRLSLRPLRELYGHTPANQFGPLALKALRERMITQPVTVRIKVPNPKTGKRQWQDKLLRTGLARGVINQRIGRIKRVFAWGAENELVPGSMVHALQAVRGLDRGRSAARETDPVKPVADDLVNATLPLVRPQVAAMVELQRHTGMRPGELVIMRGIDLDVTGKLWLYRPGPDQGPAGAHKTAHHGYKRVIVIGPRGQEILRPWLRLNVEEYLFQPREAVEALRAETRKKPQSKPNKRKKNPKRAAGERYTIQSYGKAILRACKRAGLPCWHPHQLRHSAATEIRKEFGLDAARAVLGHQSPAITEVYAELDAGTAAEVMERLG